MDASSPDTAEELPLGEAALEADPAEADALMDKIAEENISAQAAAVPPPADTPSREDEDRPLASAGANFTEAIIDPETAPSEHEIVQDIDALLADISGVADAARQYADVNAPETVPHAEDEPLPAPEESIPQPETLGPGESEGDPEALLAAADELAAAGGTHLEADEPAGESAETEPAEPPQPLADALDLDAALAARAEEIDADRELRLDETLPEEVDQQFVPGPLAEAIEPAADAEREALLDDADAPDEPVPAASDVAAVQVHEEAAPSRRRPLDGLAGRLMEKLLHWIEAPIARLSKDARYTVSFFAVAFLIGSVALLIYALFIAG